ncbi:MAG TPA: hypothetical protein VJU53_09795 [Burkholderiaceae bacterium]|nr:hypothetical protein [Burkholderiaceae bacterium]
MFKGLFAAAIAAAALRCVAAPVGFADSWMVMGEFGREFKQLDAMYSPTARYSIAATVTQMEDADQRTRVNLAVVHYNRLLWRRNGPESQFNGYLSAGAGWSTETKRSNAAFQTDKDQAVAAIGAQIDYETRLIYLAGKTHYWKSSRFTVGYNSVQAGFAFYKTGWDDTQPWLIAEISRMPGVSDEYDKALYLRLVNKGFFLDVGIDDDRRPKLNFRYTF